MAQPIPTIRTKHINELVETHKLTPPEEQVLVYLGRRDKKDYVKLWNILNSNYLCPFYKLSTTKLNDEDDTIFYIHSFEPYNQTQIRLNNQGDFVGWNEYYDSHEHDDLHELLAQYGLYSISGQLCKIPECFK